MVNGNGDLFSDSNDELERLADEFEKNDDYLLEKELEKQGGKPFDPKSIDDNHPLLADLNNPKRSGYDLDNYWEGSYRSGSGMYGNSWKYTPVKSTSEYLRNSSWSNSWYYNDYKNDTKVIVEETLHEVLKELNKTVNLTSNSLTEEEVMKVKYSNGAVVNDFEDNVLYVSPKTMLKDEDNVKAGDDYYSSLDGMNGQAMLCSFMKKGIHPNANTDYKASDVWAARNIFMCDVQSGAAVEIYKKWPGFMSYITSQMEVFGVQKDYLLNKFNGEVILLDDLIETLCYNRLATDKVDYTIFHPDIVKKMLIADNDFNEMMDVPCSPESKFVKANRIYENIRDIMNLEKVEVDSLFDSKGLSLPSPGGNGAGGDDVKEDQSSEVGNGAASNKIDNTPSSSERRFTGENSYNDKMEVEGDVVSNILDHQKKLRERMKEIDDAITGPLRDEKELKNTTYKMLIPPVNPETVKAYDDFVRSNKKNINSIKDGFMFHNNHPSAPSYGLTNGDIDEHALYKIHFGEYRRLFERRDVINEKSYHVSLVIDQSGSMTGGKLEQANKLCILFSEALKFLRNTEHSIYGFETRDINTWVYKDKMYDKHQALIVPESKGGTAMGFHLGAIGDKVLAQYGEFDNKFMFVITDGQPTHHNGSLNADEHTAHIIKLLRRKGIKVFGIGILNAFSEETGKEIFGEGNFTVIDDIASSLQVLTSTLRKYLQKTSKM